MSEHTLNRTATVLGIDVGGTKVAVGVVTARGEIVQRDRYAMDRSTQAAALASIERAVDAFMHGWHGPCPEAVGLGLVGQTDPSRAVWVSAINIPITTSVDMAALLGDPLGLPLYLDNDVHAATLAELHWGAGDGARDFVYLNVGTGTAAGLVLNGQLVRGFRNYAGELGHMATGVGMDVVCPCGRAGCLEPVASGGGVIARARALLSDYPDSLLSPLEQCGALNAHAIFEASDLGDPLAARLAADMVEALSQGIANVINLLNPEVIVVGGGAWADGWLLPRVRARVQDVALSFSLAGMRGILPSILNPDHVGLLGAATLAWQARERLIDD